MAREKDMNLDPITKAPGSHPVGTGLGAAVGGVAAGAAAGAGAGPVGAVAGAIVGAVVGGLGGKAAAEAIDPTAEEAYWRENYSDEPYYEQGRSFDDYAPAYRLGVSGRTAYTGSYEESENRLADEWGKAREKSTLTWPEASAASRAAWTRIDERIGASDNALNDIASTSESANSDVIDTLNDLLETCRDGEYGFRESAEQADSVDLKNLLSRHAEECRSAGLELLTLIRKLGGKPDEGGTASGALHRGWVSVRSALSSYDDKAVLNECERGEDVAVARYRKALKQDLPAGVRDVVERQAAGAQRNHDQIKAMRDSLSS